MRGEMRKGLAITLMLGLALILGAGGRAGAVACPLGATCSPLPGNLNFVLGARVSPVDLPRREAVPAVASIFGRITTRDGTHPSALREMIVDVDKDVKINVRGYPVCEGGGRENRDPGAVMRACRHTVLGKGIAHVEIAFPGQKPIIVTSPITIFNGGEKGGKVTLYIHVFITVPAPSAVVTTVTISRKGTGLHTVSKIPVIAGGSGSLLDFKFQLGKTYRYRGRKIGLLEAKCPDGNFKVNLKKALFKNEANIPGVNPTTSLSGGIVVPCTPKSRPPGEPPGA
jgi:hypothetical protein